MDDTLPTVPLADIDELLIGLVSHPETLPVLIQSLRVRTLFVLCTAEEHLTPGPLNSETGIKIVAFRDAEGEVIPVFTSEEDLKTVVDDAPDLAAAYLRVDGEELFDTLQDARIIIQPHHPYARILSPEDRAPKPG